MRLGFSLSSILILLAPAMASTSRRGGRVLRRSSSAAALHEALLNAAVPLADYEAKTGKKLDKESHRILQQQGDDFAAVNEDSSYNFAGYSIKYARCQPVQSFSEDALKAGEFSPMVTQDIVILRLCPQKACLSSESYGCHYNYVEYALTLSDYVSIMLKYSAYKRDTTCDWCAACMAEDGQQRKLEEDMNDDAGVAAENENNNQQADGEEQAAQGDDAGADAAQEQDAANEQEQQQQQQQDEVQGDDAADVEVDDQYVYSGSCPDFDTYCSNYATECQANDDAYLDFEGYLNYMDCAEVRYNDYPFFVKPKCDGSTGAIKMVAYNDNYCIQAASNDVIKNLGLGFKDGFFEKFYSSDCIDCVESDESPLYTANSQLCNKLHLQSAKCTQDMLYDLFEGEEDESTECSYIESLRNGAFDVYGQFSTRSGGGSSWDASVTPAQAAVLGISIAMCILFIIFACYLHHSMTNLLLKSLSHRELLPRKVRSRSRTSREGSSRRSRASGEPDWDGPTIT